MNELEGISEDILNQAKNYINELLKNKKLPQTVRAQLEIQSYFLMFLVHDHERINHIYPYFVAQRQRDEKWRKWLDKLQWVVIPLIVVAVFAFFSQFMYFWIVIVPNLK